VVTAEVAATLALMNPSPNGDYGVAYLWPVVTQDQKVLSIQQLAPSRIASPSPGGMLTRVAL